MKSQRSYHTNLSFLDLLFNMLLAFAALFIISLILIKQDEQKSKKNMEAKAEFLITLTWPPGLPDDVDLWVEDPEGHLVGFRRREDGLMHLDRDDLGSENDTVQTPYGKIVYMENREIVTLRGIIPGEYVVNAHLYRKGSRLAAQYTSGDPIKVSARVEKVNPPSLIGENTIELKFAQEEKTCLRFTIDSDGKVTEFRTDIDKPLVTQKNVENYNDEVNPYPPEGP